MSKPAAIGPGSRVVMHYTLSLADGTVAERSDEDEPLEFTIGDGTLIEGLELALMGLAAGDSQVLGIDPREAFGFPDPDNIHGIPRAEFDAEDELEEGMIIGFATPGGEEIPGTVVGLGGDLVQVDFNHPLAGHELVFDVRILSVEPALDEEEIQH